ncbi:MAG: RNA-binding transcriptional accessory protein [Deltaproteobacteria bacterium]|nr:RNA-binding transcriptional accessory protein [Deltaproteobacteria bacterium]
MKTDLTAVLSAEFNLKPEHVRNTLALLGENNTIPFIARYRKEQTGSLDEVVLRDVRDRAQYLVELDERRETVLTSIGEQGKLTEELKAKIISAGTKQVLEDLYLPYKPKRRTRATIAKEKGLEPLAMRIFGGGLSDAQAESEVQAFLAGRGEPMTAEEAWAGCRDILAEQVAEDADTRGRVRALTAEKGVLSSTVAKEFVGQQTRFNDYYEHQEPVRSIPAHRYLALRRGESEKVLRVRVIAPEDEVREYLRGKWAPRAQGRIGEQWFQLLEDSWQRLLAPAVEVEVRVELKERADLASINVFAENLRNLLLLPPGGARVVLGLDPGFRTGSKWVVVERTGRVLEHGAIFPLPPQNRAAESAAEVLRLCAQYAVEVVAVGNGTASRELLAFVKTALAQGASQVSALLVNESGASVYSASDIAREEFPELDLTIRGAISIARRFQDPLAELVKIDPKSIGVGQYQHDVQQTRLRDSLDETVQSCVNQVGVNLNTASWALLRYVSGLNSAQAKEIVRHRDAHGSFSGRQGLSQVPRLGPKAFQQCAGFLRIPGASHPLDNSAVHPEHYPLVERMAGDLKVTLSELIANKALIDRIRPEEYATETVGLPTLTDILAELRKPGRDPREPRELVRFSEAITEIGHLNPGMRLEGVVTNLTHFGVFVDIGVHQDGLIHVSQLSDHFVKDPMEVVKVGQVVKVTVLSVEPERKRIALSLKENAAPSEARGAPREAQARRGPRGTGDSRGAARERPAGSPSAQPAAAPPSIEDALNLLNQRFSR